MCWTTHCYDCLITGYTGTLDYIIHHVHKGNSAISRAKLRNNCIVFEELPVSIGELTVANAVLLDDISTGNLATSINQ
jgi:hypothetical protein